MLITIETPGMFSSNCVYLFIKYPSTGMQNGDEDSLSIILAGQALLVKMLTFEPRRITG